jgi:YhcH/YjgK/YiaL family protein
MIIACYRDLVIPGELMNDHWEKALAWLKAESWKNLPEGKTEIDGDRVYAAVSSYEARETEAGPYEVHRKYADIQLVIEGKELVLVSGREVLRGSAPYAPEKDAEFLEGTPPKPDRVVLSGPLAAVFFPADAHKPSLSLTGRSSPVRKLVVKVALS